jgi:exosortase
MNLRNENREAVGFSIAGIDAGYPRVVGYLLFCLLPLILAWDAMRPVAALVTYNGTFSYAPLIPLVSVFLVYSGRKVIFCKVSSDLIAAAAMIVPGLVAVALARFNIWGMTADNQCSLVILGIVLTWAGAFVLFFGTAAFRAARFPLAFLIFTVPIPEPLLSRVTILLQEGSANVAEWFFKLGGIPYFRQDFVFQLPGFAIRVAEECSGIRSSVALLITTVLASHLFLKTSWRKVLLCALVIPLALFKNGLRIMTLSTLAIYVNPQFLYGNLHRRGGIVFFMIALVPLVLVLVFLQRREKPRPAPVQAAQTSSL